MLTRVSSNNSLDKGRAARGVNRNGVASLRRKTMFFGNNQGILENNIEMKCNFYSLVSIVCVYLVR